MRERHAYGPPRMTSPFDTVEEAIADIRAGRTVIVCDGEDRENEGDLVIAAQFATPAAINFMATHGRGLICLTLTPERCQQLELRPMTRRNESRHGTAFTVSIESREGVSTGISAYDRSHTIQTAIDPARGAEDLVQPGHIFPLRARPGGVLERAGHTEASVELARFAGVQPAGVICEILDEDGRAARVGGLLPYARRHRLKMITVAQLIAHRQALERPLRLPASPDKQQMREVMGHFATGVCVVASRREDGSPLATTVNAVTSVSLEPAMLLVCLAKDSETLAAVERTGRFAVSILSEHQREHSVRFAAKGEQARSHEVRFSEHDLGLPCLPDALASVACRVSAMHPAGDHTIVVGEALSIAGGAQRADAPLLFFRGSYTRLAQEPSAEESGTGNGTVVDLGAMPPTVRRRVAISS
jgi:3,4-dihydroxy-2-butanone 4-phosphate synthase